MSAGVARAGGWMLRERGMGASLVVATIASAFGVVLIETTAYLAVMLTSDPFIGDSETLALVVSVLGVLLTAVALYVAAIVTANTYSTVVAGRIRQIALLRLLGASAQSQRAVVARQGLIVGALGAAAGLALGLAIAAVGIALAGRFIGAAPEGVSTGSALGLIPAAGVALTTWAAAYIGSRRVLTVTPLDALGGSVDRSREDVRSVPRNVAAVTLFVAGAALLAVGVLMGLVTPLGVVVAFVGGVLSFTALALGATAVMPPVLELIGRLFRDAPARLAAQNALRHPERSSRMTIGVVMGVALVMMFAVALDSSKSLMTRASGGVLDPQFAFIIDSFGAVMMSLVAICAVIAAVGVVNLLTIGVVQRRRELGLLRAIGLSKRQLRLMVLLEAVHITVAASVTGIVLGVVYGWIAAQSLLGSVSVYDEVGPPGLVLPQVPWMPLVAVVAGAGLLATAATAWPTRLATRVVPVEALA